MLVPGRCTFEQRRAALQPLLVSIFVLLPSLRAGGLLSSSLGKPLRAVSLGERRRRLPLLHDESELRPARSSLRHRTPISYKRYEVDGLVQLGLLDHFSFFGRLTWAESRSTTRSPIRNDSGLADQSRRRNSSRSMRLRIPRGHWMPFASICKRKWIFPPTAISGDDQTKTPYLGDQTSTSRPVVFVNLPVWARRVKEPTSSKAARATPFAPAILPRRSLDSRRDDRAQRQRPHSARIRCLRDDAR